MMMLAAPLAVGDGQTPEVQAQRGSDDPGARSWGSEAPYWIEVDDRLESTEISGLFVLGAARALGVERVWPEAPGGERLQQQTVWSDAEHRALTMDDFDEDGVADLAVAMATAFGGQLVLYRGNVAALFPHADPAEQMRERGVFTRAPFLSPATIFALPDAPDFLGSGDFDNDGHRDVVVGVWGMRHLSTWLGDGRGGFSPGRDIPLAGELTAAVVGEVHRRDGIADLAVAVRSDDGAQLEVFQGPEGVLEAAPEVVPLPGAATAIVLERLDDDVLPDLAVAAGNQIVLLKGRDRSRAVRPAAAAEFPPAEPVTLSLPFEVIDMASGNFLDEAEHRPELALLSPDGAVHVLTRAAMAQLTSGIDAFVDDASLPRVADGGGGAESLLRIRASNTPADDLLLLGGTDAAAELLVTGPGAHSSRNRLQDTGIEMAYRHLLPESSGAVAALTARLSVDAYDDLVLLQAGQNEPTVQILSAPQGGGGSFLVNDLSVFGSGPLDGICDIDANTLGDQCNLNEALAEAASFTTGTVTIQFAGDGPYQSPGQNSITVPLTIDGGAGGGDPNVQIILNSQLVLDAAPSVVRGVRIIGITLAFRDNGGGNLFENNWVGLDASGMANISSSAGLTITTQNAKTTFGGTSPGAGNVIAARSMLSSFSDGDVIRGNRIGTDKTGTVSLGTQPGTVLGIAGPSTLVGGTAVGDGNLISGNQFAVGVVVTGSGALVQGNLIGTDASGATALGNRSAGVTVGSAADLVTIGGTALGAGNVISANSFPSDFGGLVISSTGTVTVQGNIIGSDSSGMASLGNRGVGISLQTGGHTIGGTVGSAANTIVDSQAAPGGLRTAGNGIEMPLAAASDNLIQGNRIGVGLLLTPLGNQGHGIIVTSSAADNLIGGTEAGAGNEIRHNGGAGILVSGNAGKGNRILGNAIDDNGGLGIDLSVVTDPDGPTPNDAGDGDGGPNGLQNFPTIDSAADGTLHGSLASKPDTTYRVEVFANAACDPSGFGEGGNLLGATEVITDGNGEADFTFNAGGLNNPSATATDDATGDTSEFSACFPADAPQTLVNSVGDAPDNDIGDGECNTGGTIDREGVPEPECTLRAAFEEQLPQVLFDIPQDQYPLTGAPLIQPGSPYPTITHTVTVDAGSQPGVGAVQIDFGQSGSGGLASEAADGPTGLFCPDPGAGLQLAGTNIQILPGLALFCYGEYGVWLRSSLSTLEGVKVGTDFADTPGLGGLVGVLIEDVERLPIDEDLNRVINSLIVSNAEAGVKIRGLESRGNVISGNFIGTDATGRLDLGNGTGILLMAPENIVGGESEADRNLIGNHAIAGIQIQGPDAHGNIVLGNYIGTTADGLQALDDTSDQTGIRISNASLNTIGGGSEAENLIAGNRIGIEVSGPGARFNGIAGNLIGTDATGVAPLANAEQGIVLTDNSRFNRIGQFQPNPGSSDFSTFGNVISANGHEGVLITNGASDNRVIENFIGTDEGATLVLGNGSHGVFVSATVIEASGGSALLPLGGADPRPILGNEIIRNTIAFNAGDGVAIAGEAYDNSIRENSIFANDGLGIDLGDDGVTPNDPGDTLPGPNDLRNFPVIESVLVDPTGILVVRGTVEGPTSGRVVVEAFDNLVCDAAGHGEGELFQGSVGVRPMAAGPVPFKIVFLWAGGSELTTTATDDRGGPTSEFSECLTANVQTQALVINEVDAITGDDTEHIELSSAGAGGQSLTGRVLVLYEGVTDTSYAAFDLDAMVTDVNGYFVAGNAAAPGVDLVFDDLLLHDGPAAVALYDGNAVAFPDGAPVTTVGLIDAVVYGPAGAPDAELLALLNPGQPQIDEAAAGNAGGHSNQRCPDSAGGERYTDLYAPALPTSGARNTCAVCRLEPATASSEDLDGAHTVTATVLLDRITPAEGVAVDFAVTAGPNLSAQGSDTTDVAGQASFTYSGQNEAGIDEIEATGLVGGAPFSCLATHDWLGAIFADGFEEQQ